MSEIDWSKAPEGAQYYCVDNRLFYKFDGAGRGMCTNPRGSWFPCGDINDYEDGELIPRPSSPAWNGEGLPPVGTVCEIRHKVSGIDSDWIMAKINYSSPHNIVATSIDGGIEFAAFTRNSQFRPIRTPEQIAAEDRESHVLAMLCYDALGGTRRGLAEALYDAGYRKVEP